jgi:dethiobiotin synthetase
MKAYFITATDTEAGKTFITTGILKGLSNKGLKTLGFKPVASGCQPTEEGLRNDDALQIQAAANLPLGYDEINPYAFEPAIAPHIAAQQANVSIDLDSIVEKIKSAMNRPGKLADYVLVEGVGGWQVPLNDQNTVADLAKMLGFPVILVVNMRLGSINHAILSVQSILNSGVCCAGWIANSITEMPCLEENINTLCRYFKDIPLLGHIPPNDSGADNLLQYIHLDKCKA